MRKPALLLFATLTLLPLAAAASPIQANQKLRLHNHPDGNAAPPGYGLRLDGLVTGDSGDVYTFDFDDPRSSMYLHYDDVAGSIEIEGSTWGGLDVGTTYAGGGELWNVHFEYASVVDYGSYLEVAPGGGNMGYIENALSGDHYDLIDFAGKHSYSFRIKLAHRGAGPAGLGWMNHETGGLDTHLYASDWLFVVGKPVPEPTAAVLFGAGCLVFARAARRRSAA